MPPKAKPATSSHVYVVVSSNGLDSVHASLESANERLAEAKGEGSSSSAAKVEVQELRGGSVQVDEKKPAAKPKAKAPKNDGNEVLKPKTKSPAEQRAANAAKGTKSADEDLPENVQDLLANPSNALSGLILVVTGVPPVGPLPLHFRNNKC
jgi:hypothetical protein